MSPYEVLIEELWSISLLDCRNSNCLGFCFIASDGSKVGCAASIGDDFFNFLITNFIISGLRYVLGVFGSFQKGQMLIWSSKYWFDFSLFQSFVSQKYALKADSAADASWLWLTNFDVKLVKDVFKPSIGSTWGVDRGVLKNFNSWFGWRIFIFSAKDSRGDLNWRPIS